MFFEAGDTIHDSIRYVRTIRTRVYRLFTINDYVRDEAAATS